MYKKIIFLSLTLFVPQIHFASQRAQIEGICQQKQLRLHFDINKTIIATDAAQGKDLETTINGILAEFTFEKWDGEQSQSYYAYVTKQIAQENPDLSKADETFKSKRSERLKEFPTYLKKHPELLAKYEQEKSRMLKILQSKEMVIFPSFYKTIQWLNDYCPKKYALYLRTFGKDLPEVVTILEKNTPLKFAGQGAFQGTNLTMTIPSNSLFSFFTDQDLKNYAIRDDYSYWKSHGFQAVGGKPFPIDLNDAQTVSIFFDDNANDPDKPIIHPIGPREKLENSEKLLKAGNIVAVNPKEAILDEDYFIDKIKALLGNEK